MRPVKEDSLPEQVVNDIEEARAGLHVLVCKSDYPYRLRRRLVNQGFVFVYKDKRRELFLTYVGRDE